MPTKIKRATSFLNSAGLSVRALFLSTRRVNGRTRQIPPLSLATRGVRLWEGLMKPSQTRDLPRDMWSEALTEDRKGREGILWRLTYSNDIVVEYRYTGCN